MDVTEVVTYLPTYRSRLALAAPDVGVAFAAISDLDLHRPTPGGASWHSHPQEYQFIWFLYADCQPVLHLSDKEFVVGPRAVVAVKPGVVHCLGKIGSPGKALILDLRISDRSTHDLALFAREIIPENASVLLPRVTPDMSVERLRHVTLSRGDERLARLVAFAWSVLADIATSRDVYELKTDMPVSLRHAESFIEDHLSAELTVTSIAKAAGISRSQLWRIYMDHMKVTPVQRIRQIRLAKARQLLDRTTLSVKEIAVACGFSNQNHFARIFKEQTGVTPSAFRQKGKL